MAPEQPAIEPILTDTERAELGNLDYFTARIAELRDRGLIPAESHAAIEAETRLRRETIERHGRYEGLMRGARSMKRARPADALESARLARECDPAEREAWILPVEILWSLERDDEAVALCAQAATRFPELDLKLETMRSEVAARAESREIRAERSRRERELARQLEEARKLLLAGDAERAAEIGQEILAQAPRSIDALRLSAHALDKLGRLEESLALYQRLQNEQPMDATWPQMVRQLRNRMQYQSITGQAHAAPAGSKPAGSDEVVFVADEPSQPWSWASIAAEFLEEHWQKLILCLAVLLIVVSSSVGAHMLLGPLLWMPAGKCAMALVWTIAFAALGAGLIGWGAKRAGQMMLVATLCVVPIHFMLAGELRLVTQPTTAGLIAAVVDGLSLMALSLTVAGMLLPRDQARLLTAALWLIGIGSVFTSRDGPVDWSWQFAAFQTPGFVLAGLVGLVGRLPRGKTPAGEKTFLTLCLGLLGFTYLACTIRIGVYTLQLAPAFYSVPAMLGAIAVVDIARLLARHEKDPTRIAAVRFGGYVLSGLAFALALGAPPLHSAVGSANAIATSALGFALYAVALRRERHPAFLYLSLGAIVAARLGAQYFLADRLQAVIDALRGILGYPGPLPLAYLALAGLIANPALAVLAAWFRRGWQDERLARHCHYIGLPIAFAACLWSCQEPLAASIVLSTYAVYFLLAVWLYAVPAVTYAALAAACGASYFGSGFLPVLKDSELALLAVSWAWVYIAVRRMLVRLGVGSAYTEPWDHFSRALTPLAFVMATFSIAVRTPHYPSAAMVFLLTGTSFALSARERPRPLAAALVLLCYVELSLCIVSWLTGLHRPSGGVHALILAADALVLLLADSILRVWLERRAGRPLVDPGDSTHPSVLAVYRTLIPRFVVSLIAIADILGVQARNEGWVPGIVWLLGAAAVLGTSRRGKEVLADLSLALDVGLEEMVLDLTLVYLAIGQFVAGSMALSHWWMALSPPGLAAGGLAATAAGLAVVFWLTGLLIRRRGAADFYADPCWNASLALTFAVVALSIGSRLAVREAYPYGVAALLVTAGVSFLLAGARHWRELVYWAVVQATCASYIALLSTGQSDPANAYVLGLAAVVQGLAWWCVAFGVERIAGGRLRSHAAPLFHASVGLVMAGVVLSDRSPLAMVLASLGFLLAIKSLPRLEWLYAAIGSLAAACYFEWVATMPPIAMLVVLLAASLVLWAAGVMVQVFGTAVRDRLALRPLPYERPLFEMSILAAAIGVWLRAWLSLHSGVGWTVHGWFPLCLAVLSLLMLRAYPSRALVHISLAWLSASVIPLVSPSLSSIPAATLAGVVLALVLYGVNLALRDFEAVVCRRLGVGGSGYVAVVRAWSGWIFSVATIAAIVLVFSGMSAALWSQAAVRPVAAWLDWWMLLGTLGLSTGYLVLACTDPLGWTAAGPGTILAGLHWSIVLSTWWLGAAGSPLAAFLPPAAVYYPIATAAVALSAVLIGWRLTDLDNSHEPGWIGDALHGLARPAMAAQTCLLALVAIAFTGGSASGATVATLVLVTLALALAALLAGWVPAAAASAVAWTAALAYAGFLAAPHLGWTPTDPRVIWVCWGMILAAASLWRMAAIPRRWDFLGKGHPGADEPTRNNLFALALEGVASAAALLASAIVLANDLATTPPPAITAFAGVGVLVAAAVLHVALVLRWRVEWPVYVAQGLMLASYVDFRVSLPLSSAADAAVLTALGYLDMAIAEVLERLEGARPFVRPTRHVSLVLPLLPLLLIFRTGLDDVSLFYLAAAATFYATACGRLHWRWLGYASAVFANATLWLLWSRIGWRLADAPQFYLVPVGLSAILFAEVNRELGRSTINAIRSVGLVVIYTSMAMPIWRIDSFGAWLAVLIASLVGVFVGIGLRLQTFLWLGLTTFVLDVAYELGRVSVDHALAKWAIMCALGLMLLLFVAFNEKKRILSQMLSYYAQARTWE